MSLVSAAALEGINAFQTLDVDQRNAIKSKLRATQYKAGEIIINHSENERDVFFIISGRVRTLMMSSNGKEVQFDDIEAGEMFGEIAALDGRSRTCDCVALTDTSLAVMTQNNFLFAVSTFDGLNLYIMTRLTQILRSYAGRVFEFSTHSVKDRVRYEVYRIAARQAKSRTGDITISDAPTHADIAARISSHREAVTRELKSLEKAGIITWKPGNHIVHNIGALMNPDSKSMEYPDETTIATV